MFISEKYTSVFIKAEGEIDVLQQKIKDFMMQNSINYSYLVPYKEYILVLFSDATIANVFRNTFVMVDIK